MCVSDFLASLVGGSQEGSGNNLESLVNSFSHFL